MRVPFNAVCGMGFPTPRGAPRDSDEREGLPDCLCTYVMSVDPSRRLTEISLLRLFLDAVAPHPYRSAW